MSNFTADEIERFWSKVDRSRGPAACWIWAAGKSRNGYGGFWAAGKQQQTHRMVWEITHGTIPAGMQVCHTCDIRECVNPIHLWLGTNADNHADKVAKGRQAKGETSGATKHPERVPRGDAHYLRIRPEKVVRGEQHGGARLTKEQVLDIRRRYAAGGISQGALAREYNISQGVICNIIRRKLWIHI